MHEICKTYFAECICPFHHAYMQTTCGFWNWSTSFLWELVPNVSCILCTPRFSVTDYLKSGSTVEMKWSRFGLSSFSEWPWNNRQTPIFGLAASGVENLEGSLNNLYQIWRTSGRPTGLKRLWNTKHQGKKLQKTEEGGSRSHLWSTPEANQLCKSGEWKRAEKWWGFWKGTNNTEKKKRAKENRTWCLENRGIPLSGQTSLGKLQVTRWSSPSVLSWLEVD